jgi:hypothetical protein
MAGRGPRDRAVRVRVRPVRVLPGGRCPGLPAADPAGIHRAGIVRGTGRDPGGGHEPGRAARGGGLRRGRVPGLPVRHGLPRGHRARPGPARRLAGRARLRRGGAFCGDDRRSARGASGGGGRVFPGAEPGPGARRIVHRGRLGYRCGRPGFGRRRDHRGRGARLGRRARITADRGQLGTLPAPARQARPGRAATRRADADPDGPGRGAGTGDLRLARHGRARLPADDDHGHGRHAAPRAADRTGDRPGGCGPGAGRDGWACRGGRDDGDPVVLTGGRRASRPSWSGTRRHGWSGRGCRPGPA